VASQKLNVSNLASSCPKAQLIPNDGKDTDVNEFKSKDSSVRKEEVRGETFIAC
jgi:hypothetical protein